jgi:hypothetical protein
VNESISNAAIVLFGSHRDEWCAVIFPTNKAIRTAIQFQNEVMFCVKYPRVFLDAFFAALLLAAGCFTLSNLWTTQAVMMMCREMVKW